jgi:hypothetical protein
MDEALPFPRVPPQRTIGSGVDGGFAHANLGATDFDAGRAGARHELAVEVPSRAFRPASCVVRVAELHTCASRLSVATASTNRPGRRTISVPRRTVAVTGLLRCGNPRQSELCVKLHCLPIPHLAQHTDDRRV